MNQLLCLDVVIVLWAKPLVGQNLLKVIVGNMFFFTHQMFQNFLHCPSQGKKM